MKQQLIVAILATVLVLGTGCRITGGHTTVDWGYQTRHPRHRVHRDYHHWDHRSHRTHWGHWGHRRLR